MNDFDDCDTTDIGDTDAFELYLEQPVDHGCGPPLTWWHFQEQAGRVPKSFAWMAKDFLSCPGMYSNFCHGCHYSNKFTVASVDVEQVFSFSGKTVNPLRTCLSDESVRSSVVLNSWTTIPALDVKATVKDKLLQGWKRGANRELHDPVVNKDPA